MKQLLGIQLSKDNSSQQLVLFHLTQLQGQFGGMALLSAITRLKRTNTKRSINWLDIHIVNLSETYGKALVVKVYTMTYALDKMSQKITA